MTDGPFTVASCDDGSWSVEGRDAEGVLREQGSAATEPAARHWCGRLNAAYALGARAAEQAAAGTVKQLEAALAEAREKIEQLVALARGATP